MMHSYHERISVCASNGPRGPPTRHRVLAGPGTLKGKRSSLNSHTTLSFFLPTNGGNQTQPHFTLAVMLLPASACPSTGKWPPSTRGYKILTHRAQVLQGFLKAATKKNPEYRLQYRICAGARHLFSFLHALHGPHERSLKDFISRSRCTHKK